MIYLFNTWLYVQAWLYKASCYLFAIILHIFQGVRASCGSTAPPPLSPFSDVPVMQPTRRRRSISIFLSILLFLLFLQEVRGSRGGGGGGSGGGSSSKSSSSEEDVVAGLRFNTKGGGGGGGQVGKQKNLSINWDACWLHWCLLNQDLHTRLIFTNSFLLNTHLLNQHLLRYINIY